MDSANVSAREAGEKSSTTSTSSVTIGTRPSDASASVRRWYAAAAAKLDAIGEGRDRDASAQHEQQEAQAGDLIGSEEGGLDAMAAKLHMAVRHLLIASGGMHGTAVATALSLATAALLDVQRLQIEAEGR